MKNNIEFFTRVLQDLFKTYKKKMRLNKNWSVTCETRDADGDYAEVEYDYKDRDFRARFNPEMNKTVKDLRDSIIHEFWHILLAPMKDRFERTLDKIEDGKTINIKRLRQQIKNEDERLVRKFTQIILDLERENK